MLPNSVVTCDPEEKLSTWWPARSPLSEVPNPVPNQKWARIVSTALCQGVSRDDSIPVSRNPLYITWEVTVDAVSKACSGCTIAAAATSDEMIATPVIRLRYRRRPTQSNPQE